VEFEPVEEARANAAYVAAAERLKNVIRELGLHPPRPQARIRGCKSKQVQE